MDPFAHIVTRIPHMEHERRWRLHAEGELRNRVCPAEAEYTVRTLDPAPQPMPDALARPLERLRRAALGQCIDCGGWLDYFDDLRCLHCLTRLEP